MRFIDIIAWICVRSCRLSAIDAHGFDACDL
jgi:hypothetical protein